MTQTPSSDITAAVYHSQVDTDKIKRRNYFHTFLFHHKKFFFTISTRFYQTNEIIILLGMIEKIYYKNLHFVVKLCKNLMALFNTWPLVHCVGYNYPPPPPRPTIKHIISDHTQMTRALHHRRYYMVYLHKAPSFGIVHVGYVLNIINTPIKLFSSISVAAASARVLLFSFLF